MRTLLATRGAAAARTGGRGGQRAPRSGPTYAGGGLLGTIGGATLPSTGIPVLPVAFAALAVALAAARRRPEHDGA